MTNAVQYALVAQFTDGLNFHHGAQCPYDNDNNYFYYDSNNSLKEMWAPRQYRIIAEYPTMNRQRPSFIVQHVQNILRRMPRFYENRRLPSDNVPAWKRQQRQRPKGSHLCDTVMSTVAGYTYHYRTFGTLVFLCAAANQEGLEADNQSHGKVFSVGPALVEQLHANYRPGMCDRQVRRMLKDCRRRVNHMAWRTKTHGLRESGYSDVAPLLSTENDGLVPRYYGLCRMEEGEHEANVGRYGPFTRNALLILFTLSVMVGLAIIVILLVLFGTCGSQCKR